MGDVICPRRLAKNTQRVFMGKKSPERTKRTKKQKQILARHADFTDIGQIKDESTYDNNSKEALALQKIEQPPEYGAFGIDGGFGSRRYTENSSEVFEWEFGKTAIAVTDALTGSYIEERFGDEIGAKGTDSYFRHVIEGDFKYSKKGTLTSATVTGFAIWQHHEGERGDSVIYTRFNTPTTFRVTTFQDMTNRITGEQAKTVNPAKAHTFFYDSNPYETVGSIADFSNYDISKYFDSTWWSNPFVTNTVQ